MTRGAVAFVSGAVFSAGLCISGMTQPTKVIAFLDVAGAWDPSLAFVMVGAIGVAALAFWATSHRPSPLLDDRFHLAPKRRRVNPQLIVGSALFGAGWGLSGLCPGPSIVSLVSGQLASFVFVGTMLLGMAVFRRGCRARST